MTIVQALFVVGGIMVFQAIFQHLHLSTMLKRVVSVEEQMAKLLQGQASFVPDVQALKQSQVVANAQIEHLILVREEHGKIFQRHDMQEAQHQAILSQLDRIEARVG